MNLNTYRFVDDVSVLMSLVTETRSLFSGGQVLRFVSRGRLRGIWEPNDLDIYCPIGQGGCIVDLFEAQGYRARVIPAGDGFDRPYVDDTYISCVVRLQHHDGRRIDVVSSVNYSALSPIARYYASHVVNVITASSISIAYPKSTLNGRAFARPWTPITCNMTDAEEKYRRRGYQMIQFAENTEAMTEPKATVGRFYCPHVVRSFADDGTLRVWYGETTDDAISADADLLEEVKWRWGGENCMCCNMASSQEILVRKKFII